MWPGIPTRSQLSYLNFQGFQPGVIIPGLPGIPAWAYHLWTTRDSSMGLFKKKKTVSQSVGQSVSQSVTENAVFKGAQRRIFNLSNVENIPSPFSIPQY
jgi:hypothetical protein